MQAVSLIRKIQAALMASFCCCACVVACFGQAKPPVITKTSDELMKDIVKWEEPEYPAIARLARAGGPVEVELLIDELGNVVSAHAISGHPLLHSVVVKAAHAWKFKPTSVDKVPVWVKGLVRYTFPSARRSYEGTTLRELERKARARPGSAQAHYELGAAYLIRSRYTEAIAQLSRAIRIKPHYPEAYLKLGHAYSRVGSSEKARDAFSEAVRFDPNLSEALHALGLVNLQLGRYEEAITALKRSLEIEPIITSYFLLGKCYWNLKQYDGAVSAYRQGLAKYPESDMGHFGLGEVYLSQQKFQDAINEFQQAVKLSAGPGISESHYYLGIAFLRSGDKQAALKEYEILKKLNPELAEQLFVEIDKSTIQKRKIA